MLSTNYQLLESSEYRVCIFNHFIQKNPQWVSFESLESCRQALCSLPDSFNNNKILALFYVLEMLNSLNAMGFLNILNYLKETGPLNLAPLPFQKKIYQMFADARLGSKSLFVITQLYKKKLTFDNVEMIALNENNINLIEIERLFEHIKTVQLCDKDKACYEAIYLTVMFFLSVHGVPLSEDILKIFEKTPSDSSPELYKKNLDTFLSWIFTNFQLKNSINTDNSNTLKAHGKIGEVSFLLEHSNRNIFNFLARAGLYFGFEDLIELSKADDENLSLTHRIIGLANAGAIITPMDIKYYLIRALSCQETYEFFCHKLIPLLSRRKIALLTKNLVALSAPHRFDELERKLEQFYCDLSALGELPPSQMHKLLRCFWSRHLKALPYHPNINHIFLKVSKLELFVGKFLERESVDDQPSHYYLKERITFLAQLDKLLSEDHLLHFDEFEALIKYGDDIEICQKFLSLKKSLGVVQSSSPTLKLFILYPEIVDALQHLVTEGFALDNRFLKAISCSPKKPMRLAECLIRHRNFGFILKPEHLEILIEARQNAFFIAKMWSAENIHEVSSIAASKKHLVDGFLNHYQIELPSQLKALFYEKTVGLPDTLLSTPIFQELEESLAVIQDAFLYEQTNIFDILLHKNPLELARAFVKLKLADICHTKYKRLIQEPSVISPESFAHGLMICANNGELPKEICVLQLLNVSNLKNATYFAEAIGLYHQHFGNFNFDGEFGLERILSSIAPVFTVRGLMLKSQHAPSVEEKQSVLQGIEGLEIFGVFDKSGLSFSEVASFLEANAFTNIPRRQQKFLIWVLTELYNNDVPINYMIYSHFLGLIQSVSSESFEEIAEVLNKEINESIVTMQQHWIQNTLDEWQESITTISLPRFPHLQALLKRYSCEHIRSRGGSGFLRKHVENLKNFLMLNPHYLSFFEEIASIYNRGCVNQPTQGFLELSSWMFVCERKSADEKIMALAYRYALEAITTFVESSQLIHKIFKAEASHKILYEVFYLLKTAGHNAKDWPHVSDRIANIEAITLELNSHCVQKFIKSLTSSIQKLSRKDLLDFVMCEARELSALWGTIMFPEVIAQARAHISERKNDLEELIELKMNLYFDIQEILAELSPADAAIFYGVDALPITEIPLKLPKGANKEQSAIYEKIVLLQKSVLKNIQSKSPNFQEKYASLVTLSTDALYHLLKDIEKEYFGLVTEEVTRRSQLLINNERPQNILVFQHAQRVTHSVSSKRTAEDTLEESSESVASSKRQKRL